MKLWFRNSKDERKFVCDCATECEAVDAISNYCTDRNFVIPYVRQWVENGVKYHDVGSYTEFFELDLDD